MSEYLDKIVGVLSRIEAEESAVMDRASEAVTDVICRDGLVHVFGCGHSHLARSTRSIARAGSRASRRFWTRT